MAFQGDDGFYQSNYNDQQQGFGTDQGYGYGQPQEA